MNGAHHTFRHCKSLITAQRWVTGWNEHGAQWPAPVSSSHLIIHAACSALNNQTHPAENHLQIGKYRATMIYFKSVFKILQPL